MSPARAWLGMLLEPRGRKTLQVTTKGGECLIAFSVLLSIDKLPCSCGNRNCACLDGVENDTDVLCSFRKVKILREMLLCEVASVKVVDEF